jgi:ubiquinone/menaquinone biosynthesis C-methylase UbiE
MSATNVKACCAAFYESDWVRLLLGESFHPGGPGLTRRLGQLLALRPGMTVIDAACGPGSSALQLASMFKCEVTGIDLSISNVDAAMEKSRKLGLEKLVNFRMGDAESLPVAAASADALICECAFCTFPHKVRAATEFARVLRPGGHIGLSDITRSGELPVELEGLFGWIACLADARPVEEYVAYLHEVEFRDIAVERHDKALAEMVDTTTLRLLSAELMARLGSLNLSGLDLGQAKRIASAARRAVRAGTLGYALITARR